MSPTIFEVLQRLGTEFSRPGPWVEMVGGFLFGYAVGRVARAVVPPLAFLYLLAILLGRANPERLVAELLALGQEVWGFLSGVPLGLSLGSALGFLSGVNGR